jgi:hypothetical protein
VTFTENCQVLPLGTALWATATDPGSYRLHFADVQSQQVGSYAVVEEMGHPVIMALRLKLDDGKISEIEQIVSRRNWYAFAPWALVNPNPVFSEAVEPARRSSREFLAGAADSYYTAIEKGDGSIVPVVDECIRTENGVQTCLNPTRELEHDRMSVFDGIDVGTWTFVKVRDRRFPIIDEERGLAFSINFFEVDGNVRSVEVRGKGTVQLGPESLEPNASVVAELFKVVDGKIQRIETVLGPQVPYGTKPGW